MASCQRVNYGLYNSNNIHNVACGKRKVNGHFDVLNRKWPTDERYNPHCLMLATYMYIRDCIPLHVRGKLEIFNLADFVFPRQFIKFNSLPDFSAIRYQEVQ